MPQPVASFNCPQCGHPAGCTGGGGSSNRTTTGRRRSRRCKPCGRSFITFQQDGEEETFVRWVKEMGQSEQEEEPVADLFRVGSQAWNYGVIRDALLRAGAPEKYLVALARAGRRLGLETETFEELGV